MERVTVWGSEMIKEANKQLRIAGPLVVLGLLLYVVQLTSLIFVGHLGDELVFSGTSLANSFASVIGFMVLAGMASALETLCGQSYGAKQHHLLGVHMQGAMIVHLIVTIFLVIIWANSKSLLVLLHQDAAISAQAGSYIRFLIPGIFAYGLLQCLIVFLQTQSIVIPMVLLTGVSTILHIPLCWALTHKTRLGSRGAALAISITYWNNFLLLALYVKFSSSCKKTWRGFSKEAFKKIFIFLKLAIPSALMLCLKVWSYELVVILSGLLPHPKLETSVQSITLSTYTVVWVIPYGLSGGVSTRVSNELGAWHPKAARLAACVAVLMTLIESAIVSLVIILVRNIWGNVYTNVEEVIRGLASIMPILACGTFLDGVQVVITGICRGCGWQTIGAIISFGCFFLVGIPGAVVFAFVLHMKGKGLWLGIICALIIQIICLLIITIRTNWNKQVENAARRVHGSEIPVHSETVP